MSAVGVAAAAPRVRVGGAALHVGVVVALATVVHAALALSTAAPWIFPDELIYSEMAKALAAGDAPSFRGEPVSGYGLVYQLLLAPAWLLDDVERAYAAARVVNALLVSLAAVPAFVLARRFVDHRSALFVSAFAVFVPSTALASVLMTENAFYVVFLASVAAIAATLERPTLGRQLVVLGAIGVAYATRTQAVALVPAYLSAVALLAWLDRRAGGPSVRSAVRAYVPTLALVAALAAVVLVRAAATGTSLLSVFGAYADAARSLDPAEVPEWLVIHAADLALYVLVVPLAAALLVIVLGLRPEASRTSRLYAALTVCVSAWTLLAVAAFASESDAERAASYPGTNDHLFERSTFVLVPLLLVGFALWVELGLPRPRRVAIPVVVVAALLPALIPFERIDDNLNFQASALVPWVALPDNVVARVALLLAVGGVAALAFFRLRRRIGYVWCLIGASFALGLLAATGSLRHSSTVSADAAFANEPAWVDRAVPDGAEVAVIWEERDDAEFAESRLSQRAVWVNEFFNRSVGRVYALGARMPYALPDTVVRADGGGRLVTADGGPVRVEFVLARCSTPIAGTVLAVQREAGVALVRAAQPVRLDATRPRC